MYGYYLVLSRYAIKIKIKTVTTYTFLNMQHVTTTIQYTCTLLTNFIALGLKIVDFMYLPTYTYYTFALYNIIKS